MLFGYWTKNGKCAMRKHLSGQILTATSKPQKLSDGKKVRTSCYKNVTLPNQAENSNICPIAFCHRKGKL